MKYLTLNKYFFRLFLMIGVLGFLKPVYGVGDKGENLKHQLTFFGAGVLRTIDLKVLQRILEECVQTLTQRWRGEEVDVALAEVGLQRLPQAIEVEDGQGRAEGAVIVYDPYEVMVSPEVLEGQINAVLQYCIENGYVEMAKWFLELACSQKISIPAILFQNLHIEFEKVLRHAIDCRYLNVVKILLSKFNFVSYGQCAAFESMFENLKNQLWQDAIKGLDWNMMNAMLGDFCISRPTQIDTILGWVLENAHEHSVELLNQVLKSGISDFAIYPEGNTVLHLLMKTGNYSMVLAFFKFFNSRFEGQFVRKYKDYLKYRNIRGQLPLNMAVEQGDESIILWLLNLENIDVLWSTHASDNLALQAFARNQIKIVKWLIDHGVFDKCDLRGVSTDDIVKMLKKFSKDKVQSKKYFQSVLLNPSIKDNVLLINEIFKLLVMNGDINRVCFCLHEGLVVLDDEQIINYLNVVNDDYEGACMRLLLLSLMSDDAVSSAREVHFKILKKSLETYAYGNNYASMIAFVNKNDETADLNLRKKMYQGLIRELKAFIENISKLENKKNMEIVSDIERLLSQLEQMSIRPEGVKKGM